jgi:dihydrofolate reductase
LLKEPGAPKAPLFARRLRGAGTHIMGRVTYLEMAGFWPVSSDVNEIIAHGGTQFVRSLVRLGLVDRYRFYVLPFAAGEGAPLFAPAAHPGRLRLEQSTAYPSGILELVYAPARRPARRTGGAIRRDG